MSRRSLRIDNSLLDRSLPHSSASFSLGRAAPGWINRSVGSRSSRRFSASCSESPLVQTPRKTPALNPVLNSSVHSDASLLSSLLDESSIQESTVLECFWGLDHDSDPKENTMVCEQSIVIADSTLIGPESTCSKRSALIGPESTCSKRSALIGPDSTCSKRSALIGSDSGCSKHSSRVALCKDCEQLQESSSSLKPGATEETPTIYCRERGRGHGGVLRMFRRWFSCVLCVLLGLYQHLQKHREVTDVLQLWLDSSLFHLKRAALLCGSALRLTWRQVCQCRSNAPHRLGGSYCSVMKESNLKESRSNGGALYKTAADVFRWLRKQCYQTKTHGNSSRFLLGFILLVLLLLSLIFSLIWWGPSVLQSELVEKELPFLHSFSSDSEKMQTTALQLHQDGPQMGGNPEETPGAEEEALESSKPDSSRLLRLEQSVTSLWKQLEVRVQMTEQRHTELLQMLTSGQETRERGEEELELNLSRVLNQQLKEIRTQLEEDRMLWEQAREQDLEQQQIHSLRLNQVEQQLQRLSERTQEMERKQAAALMDSSSSNSVPAALRVSSGVESQEELILELSRLRGALQSVRHEVEALSSCRGRCSQLESLQETVLVLVQEQLRSLVFGSQVVLSRDRFVSGSVLQWFSERFVSEESLQGALSALELRLMEHIRNQLQQEKKEEGVRSPQTQGGAVTEEEVEGIVQKALRRFSEDRTGLADYALESGGGSVLSTRCSQTYETKAALLSLFGFPLWYFSQSPRAVIQPDIHPGNCWAFRGSSGVVVIRLSMSVVPTGFSLEHIPKALAPSGSLRSAPRDFSVYGLQDEEEEEGQLLGTYLYDEDGDALQTYSVSEEIQEPFQIIMVKVLTNWGHEDYTCLYRFRVHGKPIHNQD